MIKYRPHRSTLDDAMADVKEFFTLDDMYDHIVSEWSNAGIDELISKEDLSISENTGKDTRIDWKETRYVLTRRFGNETYKLPQCIGMCSME